MGKIITVGREFGSGGREIGRKLAEKLRFAYYDHEIVVEIAKRTDLATEYIQSVEEKRPFPLTEYYNRAYFLGFAESGNGSAA